MFNQDENSYKLINEQELKRFRLDNPTMDDLEVIATLTIQLTQQLRQMEKQRCLTTAKGIVADEPKKSAKRGPQIARIFNSDQKKRQAVAEWIHKMYTAYYDQDRSVLVIENSSYDLTDFLLAIYYVLVEQGHVISVINNKINSQYYKFLTEDCQLGGRLSVEKVFSIHLKKLISTGKDFYQLTTEIVKKNSATGGYTQKEYETMTAMTATIKKLLPKS